MNKAMIFFLLLTFHAYASTPKNDLYIPVNSKAKGGLSKDEFNNTLNAVASLYKDEEITLFKMWDDGQVNAYAENLMGDRSVNFFGGMARYEHMTQDAYALVACHEYGHHLGGAPRKTNHISLWASSEGQSDYFATSKCIKRYFELVPAKASIAHELLPEKIVEACSNDEACLRGVIAAEQLATVYSKLETMHGYPSTLPTLEVNSPIIVEVTNRDEYPTNQCRLDTMVEGLLCDVDPLAPVSSIFPKVGYCSRANGSTIGNRPLCWFAP